MAVEPSSDRVLTLADLPAFLGALVGLAAIVVLAALGHRILAALALGCAILMGFARMPRER